MKRKRVIMAIGLALAAIIAFRPVKTFFDIDRCLDLGGAWDEQSDTCMGLRLDYKRH